MNNTVVDEYCARIRKDGPNMSIQQLKVSLDSFVSTLKEIDSLDKKYVLLDQIISSLIHLPDQNRILAAPELITHELFTILRDMVLIEHLRRTQTKVNLAQDFLSNVSLLLLNLCYHINDTNITHIKDLLFHQPLINEIASCLHEIGIYGKHLNDHSVLRSIRSLLLSIKYFRKKEMITNEYALITPILPAVVHCLCSSYAVHIIKSLERNFSQSLNDLQRLFLDAMPKYLLYYSTDYRDPDSFIKVLRILLHEFVTWITSCPSDSYLQCAHTTGNMIDHLSFFLIRPVERDYINVFSEEFVHQYCKLVLYWSSVLSSILTNSSRTANINLITRITIQNLYNLSLHLNVLNYMKDISNLVPMLMKVTNAEDDSTQLNAYRCLGKLLIEADIKTMTNPDQISRVYIKFLTKSIGDVTFTERYYNLLESLKNYVQHDQVKNELIKQQILPLLIKCVVETRFDPIRGHQAALEILLALSFNNDACCLLQQNEHFITHTRMLAGNMTFDKPGLQRAAERLLWKLEKEEQAITKPSVINNFQYDVMISYSHQDQERCLHIHEQLVNDGFHVWIDRDCLRGSTMIGIANAIENSKCVLICMSDMYKQSAYCQSEAHYAFERGCRLIPVVIEQNYKPDGWLGIIVSGKIYVDFARINFQIAYEKLKNEINEQRYQSWNRSSTRLADVNQINTAVSNPMSAELVFDLLLIAQFICSIRVPKCINQWSTDHAKLFFLRFGLGRSIFLLCQRMDGQCLLQLVEMCLINPESMYQSLKSELNQIHNTLLLLADYVVFLREIKPYVPLVAKNARSVQPSLLSASSCDVM